MDAGGMLLLPYMQPSAQPESSCCPADCSSLHGCLGAKDECHRNQATSAAACAGWAVPVPAGPPASPGAAHTRSNWDGSSDWYRAGGLNGAVLTREPCGAWEGFL